MDKDRPDGEGERANGEGRPEGERPETVGPEGDTPEKEKSDKEQPIKDKPDTEKEISPAVTKKPGSKKTRSVRLRDFLSLSPDVVSTGHCPHRCVSAPSPDPNQTATRARPVTNTAYSLANQ